MYNIVIEKALAERIKEASKKYESIANKLDVLSLNPASKAILTGKPIIGAYYINCGRYALLFDIDEQNEKIKIYNLVLRAYLHKILTGRIDP